MLWTTFVRYLKREILSKNSCVVNWQLKEKINSIASMAPPPQWNVVSKDVVWSVCADGAPVMLGKIRGLFLMSKKKSPDVLLYCHTLVTKTLPHNLKNTLSIVMKIVNYIWGWAIKHSLLSAFCWEIGSLHAVLLFHAEVWWFFMSNAQQSTCIWNTRIII